MVDTLVNDETLKAPLEAADEFYVNAVGNLNRKGRIDGIRITESQVTDLQAYLTGITGEASTSLTDTANIAYLDTANEFTADQTITQDVASILSLHTHNSTAATSSVLNVSKSRGTEASPTDVLVGDRLGDVDFKGWKDGAFRIGPVIRAQVAATALNQVDGGLIFFATSGGAYVEALRFRSNTNVALNTLEITNQGAGATPTLSSNSATQTLLLTGNLDGNTNTFDNFAVGASVTGIINANVAAGAGIVESKLDVAVGAAGTVLTSNGVGSAPTYQAGGAGDMILANVQTVTGAKTFGTIGGAVGKFILAGSTSGSSILNAAAVAGTTTLTLPSATDTLVGKATTDTFTNKTIVEDGTGNAIKITKYMQPNLFDWTTDVATGDGKYYMHIPPQMDGYNLTYVHAEVITAGTTGTTDIQIHNVDNVLDMLSTKLTIDSAETGSDTAAVAAVINTLNDHVNTNDVVRIDVDAVSTTAPKGLIVTLGFREP